MRKTIIFSLLSMLTGLAIGQGSVMFPTQNSTEAIVRTVNDSTLLIFNTSSASYGHFILYDGSSVAKRIQMPKGMLVHDVKILEGHYAYFCGEQYDKGAFGYFDIDAVFNGSDSINYTLTATLFTETGITNCTTDVVNLKRLETCRLDNDTVIVAMVADSKNLIGGEWVDCTTILSAYRDGAFWECYAAYNKDGLVDFTDIAITDNFIVTLGTDTAASRCFVKTYKKIKNFPAIPYNNNFIDEIIFQNPAGPVSATTMNDDKMAIVQYNIKPGINIHFVDFMNNFSHPAPFQPSLTTTPITQLGYYSPTWEINDICSHYLDERISILGWMNFYDVSGFDSWVVRIHTTPPYIIERFLLPSTKYTSMDWGYFGNESVVGYNSNAKLSLFPAVDASPIKSCVEKFNLEYIVDTPTIKKIGNADILIKVNQKNLSLTPSQRNIKAAVDCIAE